LKVKLNMGALSWNEFEENRWLSRSHCRDHLVLNPKEANATNLGAEPKILYICDFNLREE
jgi:hypothetical protein